MWRCSPEILETKMIDMDRLADSDQPSRARLNQKVQEPGAVEGFEFVHEFAGLKKVARRLLQSEDRMAVHGLLEKAFNLVSKWNAEACLEEALYALLDSLDAPVSLKKGEAFAVVIYCVAPNVDDKLRSKWARVLRFAALTKPSNEPLRVFIKRKGGINACASRYAEYVRRPGKV
jgi:hypothetical protein